MRHLQRRTHETDRRMSHTERCALPVGQCLACEIEAQIADLQDLIDTLRRTLDHVDHITQRPAA